MIAVQLQRKCGCGGSCGGCGDRALKPREAPLIVHDVLRSSGQPLDRSTRSFFEPRVTGDFTRGAATTPLPQRLAVGAGDDSDSPTFPPQPPAGADPWC